MRRRPRPTAPTTSLPESVTRRHILLVEDDPDSVTLFEYAVSKLSLPCALGVARDGLEAIDYLNGTKRFADRQIYPLPDLVLLDLRMPLATGFEVLQQVRQSPTLRRLIVVVFTASASDADISTAYDLGANGYLVKPSTLDELVELVRSLASFWLTHNVTAFHHHG